MDITVETITPELAKQYLKANTDNRKLRPKRVNLYADQIQRGQWITTGDPIRFGVSGRLIDGQHRLAGVVAADVPVEAIVIRNVPDEAFKVIDSGLSRNPADVLGPNVTGGSAKAAAIRNVFVVECGGDPRKTDDLQIVSRIDIADFYQDHQHDIDEAALIGRRMYDAFAGGNRSAWTAFAFLIHALDAGMANEFIEGVHTGANLSTGDPRLALRNFLANGRKMPTAGHHLGVLIKAWNAWINGDKRTIMMIREDESFPVLAAPVMRTVVHN